MKNTFIFLVSLFLLSSCAFNSGLINQLTVHGNNSNVVLQQNNFKVIGTVRGSATANYIFGLGGKKQLVSTAKREMYNKAELEGKSRAIINVSVEEDWGWYVIVWKKTVTVHGTIIEFEK